MKQGEWAVSITQSQLKEIEGALNSALTDIIGQGCGFCLVFLPGGDEPQTVCATNLDAPTALALIDRAVVTLEQRKRTGTFARH